MHSRGAQSELGGEDCFGAIDEEERSLPGGAAWRSPIGPQHGWQLVYPSLPVLSEHVIGPGFEALQYLRVGALDLPVTPRMSDGSEAKLDAEIFAIVPEQGTSELGAVVGDDPIGDAKAASDAADKLERRVFGHLDDWDRLRPLGEFVDSDI